MRGIIVDCSQARTTERDLTAAEEAELTDTQRRWQAAESKRQDDVAADLAARGKLVEAIAGAKTLEDLRAATAMVMTRLLEL